MSKQNSRKHSSSNNNSNNDNSEQTLFQIKVDLDKIQGWQCLQKDMNRDIAQDCTINVLHLLSIIKDRLSAENIALFKNITKSGTTNAEIVDYISKYMNVHGVKKYVISKCEEVVVKSKSYEKWLNDLSIYLKPNHATIFNMALSKPKSKIVGHTIIAYMSKDNELSFLDPQQEKIINVSDIIDIYEKGKYNTLCLFFKDPAYAPLSTIQNPKKHKRSDTQFSIRKVTATKKKRRYSTPITKKRKRTILSFLSRNKQKRRSIIQSKRRKPSTHTSDMQISD